MKEEYCIQVKNANSLSISYLTRFFGSVGQVVKILKDEIGKTLIVEYANRHSVQKSLKLDGRILDQKPIRIRRLVSQRSKITCSLINENKKQNKIQPLTRPQGYIANFNDAVWQILYNEIKSQSQDQQILLLLIWSLCDELLNEINHIKVFNKNLKSSYKKLGIQGLINEQLKRLNTIKISPFQEIKFENKNNKLELWLKINYPNIQEDQSKIQNDDQLVKCVQQINKYVSKQTSLLLYDLIAASRIYNIEQNNRQTIFKLPIDNKIIQSNSFTGTVDNIGARDIFYQQVKFQIYNSCVAFYYQSFRPLSFQCSMCLSFPTKRMFEQLMWFQLSQATILSNNTVRKGKKTQICRLNEKVYVFQIPYFGFNGVMNQIQNLKLIKNPHEFSVVCIQRERKQVIQSEFKNIYNDQFIQIQEQIRVKKNIILQNQSKIQQKQDFQSLQIVLITIKQQYSNQFTNIKMQNFIAKYVQQFIISKNLLIASKQIAQKLAQSLISRQSQNILFGYGNKDIKSHVTEVIWKIYNQKDERRAKDIIQQYRNRR